MPQLKVFRTSIGFHDAFVAVPSRAAALHAWGADTDLFAMGAAEEVTDASLIAAPLADPGKVIKTSKGSQTDHLDALAANGQSKGTKSAKTVTKRRPRQDVPRPSRKSVDAAKAALSTSDQAHQSKLDAIDEEICILKDRRNELTKTYALSRRKLEAKIDAAQAIYDRAVAKWHEATN